MSLKKKKLFWGGMKAPYKRLRVPILSDRKKVPQIRMGNGVGVGGGSLWQE